MPVATSEHRRRGHLNDDLDEVTPKLTARKRSKILYFLMGFLGLLVVAALLLLTITRPRSEPNEPAAAAPIRYIGQLQREYSSAHPKIGFACELALLQPPGETRDASLVNGVRTGYKFALVDCDAKRIVRHYQVVATPLAPGVTEVRAFCGDETGEIWYDAGGSGTKCLASRQEL
jgi:hypothetical protein